MAWFVIPLIAAGIAAAGTAAASAGANAATGNQKRIKEIQAARRYGGLVTAEGRAIAEEGLQQHRQGLAALQEQQQKIMAMQGSTSGADIRAIQEGSQAALADIAERTGDRLRKAQATEEQELEDRKALRRERTMKTIGATIGAAGAAFGAASSAQGSAEGKTVPPVMPDFSAFGAQQAEMEKRWRDARSMLDSGEWTREEFDKWEEDFARYGDVDPDDKTGKE